MNNFEKIVKFTITDIRPNFFRNLTELERIQFEDWLEWKIIDEVCQTGVMVGSVWYLELEVDFEISYKVSYNIL